jgi:hypothetical protein
MSDGGAQLPAARAQIAAELKRLREACLSVFVGGEVASLATAHPFDPKQLWLVGKSRRSSRPTAMVSSINAKASPKRPSKARPCASEIWKAVSSS